MNPPNLYIVRTWPIAGGLPAYELFETKAAAFDEILKLDHSEDWVVGSDDFIVIPALRLSCTST